MASPMVHDVFGALIKINSQTAGRDRLLRMFQYGSKLSWWILEKYGFGKDARNKLKNLEYSLSTSLKLLRLGRSLDTFYGALSTIHLPDLTLRITLTLSRIASALYLLADHLLCIERVGLAQVNKKKWSKISYRCWLYSVVMNLVRDVHEIGLLIRIHNPPAGSCQPRATSHPWVNQMTTRSFYSCCMSALQWMTTHNAVTLDAIKNACDIWIPLTLLGFVDFSPGTLGLLGVISSIAGIIPLVDPAYKLSPS